LRTDPTPTQQTTRLDTPDPTQPTVSTDTASAQPSTSATAQTTQPISAGGGVTDPIIGSQGTPSSTRQNDPDSLNPTDEAKLKILFLKTFAKTAKDIAHSIGAELPKDFRGQTTDLPELSWGEFNKQFLEFSMEKEGKNLLVRASETALWQREKKQELLPWAQALNNYRKYLKLKTNTWGNTDTFYPLSIVIMAGDAYRETRIQFKKDAMNALKKWRSPNTVLPRIYPSGRDWKEAFVYDIYKKNTEKDHRELVFGFLHVLTFHRVTGVDDQGNIITRHFIEQCHFDQFNAQIEAAREEIPNPFFSLPKFGVSQRLLTQGMSEDEARQAAAIYRIEIEACLLEIWSHTNPRMSPDTFVRRHNTIWHMSMPFWKEDLPRQIDATEDPSNISYLRDLPPHVTT